MHPKKILHPTDYSESSRPALTESVNLAREHQAGLVLLHVVESLGPDAVRMVLKRAFNRVARQVPAGADQ